MREIAKEGERDKREVGSEVLEECDKRERREGKL